MNEEPIDIEKYSAMWTRDRADWRIIGSEPDEGQLFYNTRTTELLLIESSRVVNALAERMLRAGVQVIPCIPGFEKRPGFRAKLRRWWNAFTK